MMNLSKLTKAELQSTGFKMLAQLESFLNDILETKARKIKKEGSIDKLTSEFKNFFFWYEAN